MHFISGFGLVKKTYGFIQRFFGGNKQRVFLFTDGAHTKKDLDILNENLQFYCPNDYPQPDEWIEIDKIPYSLAFTNDVILVFHSTSYKVPWYIERYRWGLLHVNFYQYPNDGWNWINELLNWKYPVRINRKKIQKRFNNYVNQINFNKYQYSYLFGTGPSLSKAINYGWNNGYRIVCNTIVKDKELWHHINPHFIVAGDALYHFSPLSHARKFRKDLKQRLSEGGDTMFLYPSMYHSLVKREFADFLDRLIPVDIADTYDLTRNLRQDLRLPPMGNVLNLLLLPLGCCLSKQVCLWGFDGRAPDDSISHFWKNSEKHSYFGDIDEIYKKHPAFFENNVPKDDKMKYVKNVHGEELDLILQNAEDKGWHFYMLHFSWTKTLAIRYNQQIANNILHKIDT